MQIHNRKEINLIRKVLNGGQKTWGELLAETKIPNTNLKRRLDFMINDLHEVGVKIDERDRRKTLYYLIDRNKSRLETRRFQISEFILNMENPVSAEAESYGVVFNMYVQPETKNEDKRLQLKHYIQKLLKEKAEAEAPLFQRLASQNRIDKLALTVTIERKT